jgi:hypothetical protein
MLETLTDLTFEFPGLYIIWWYKPAYAGYVIRLRIRDRIEDIHWPLEHAREMKPDTQEVYLKREIESTELIQKLREDQDKKPELP